jgi:hypothetical protein
MISQLGPVLGEASFGVAMLLVVAYQLIQINLWWCQSGLLLTSLPWHSFVTYADGTG